MSDPFEWTEYPDRRTPGRTVILGRIDGATYAASYITRQTKAMDAIRAAHRATIGCNCPAFITDAAHRYGCLFLKLHQETSK